MHRWIGPRRQPVAWMAILTLLVGSSLLSPASVVRAQDEAPEAQETEHPFARRIPAPEFPADMQWLNVSGPLRLADLRGKFVLLDFWTYCCINCIHILPELKKLEQAYPNELVVIGVHSAKFEAERARANIEEAILRYEIEHPVLNDHQHQVWRMYGARSWPTLLLLDPEGHAVWGTSGEIQFEDVQAVLERGLPYYRREKLLDPTPLRFDLLAHRVEATPLRFPGKVLADGEQQRLFVADSNHNRLVIASLDGRLQQVIGSGAIGAQDGDFATASFNKPQGMALRGNILYVADTENHLLRKVDLSAGHVSTIAGTGEQSRRPWPGLEKLGPLDPPPQRWVGPPLETPLNSPWDLWVHEDQLYIAMAGPHQIWKMPLDESEIGPYAGNGREDVVDGPLLPRLPYQMGYSSFAQPSGLTSDGTWLYVADSEGSSVRAVPFDATKEVRTVVGTNKLPQARLFTFGDRDGARDEVRLQHVLGVTWHDGSLFVADTYNNKIKVIDAATGDTKTLSGTGEPGLSDSPPQFDEPAGISYAGGQLYVADTNNHAIRIVDPKAGAVRTLVIEGLEPPEPFSASEPPDFSQAPQHELDLVRVQPVGGKVQVQVQLQLPEGWKVNPLAPCEVWLEALVEQGPLQRDALGRRALPEPAAEFTVDVPVDVGGGRDVLRVAMDYYYCQEDGGGLCKVGSVAWNVPIEVSDQGEKRILLQHAAER